MQVGEVLANKYRVERVLGVGGMGVVVAAMHLQLDQMVALKFLHRKALTNPKIVSRFEHEARAAVRLKSEHVARILDVGRLETGSSYIVMEYLEGQDLAALRKQYGTIAVPRACDFIIQACDAIAEAHGLGIVHRDLKPGNLFLANTSHGRQTVKVLDFGISKSHMSGDDLNMTGTQDVMGSPRYMSPEQMRSAKNVDGRTDVWSLGIILYELVTGRAPFDADTLTALCLKIAMEPLPPLPALPTALPPGFDRVIYRTLEKDPARRYQSAIELAHALAPFADAESRDLAYRLGASTTVPLSGPSLMSATDDVTTMNRASGESQAEPPKQTWSRKLLFAGVGIIAASVGIIVALMSGPGGDGGSSKAPIADHPLGPGAEATRSAKQPSGTTGQPGPVAPVAPKELVRPPEAPVKPSEPQQVQPDEHIEMDPTPPQPFKPNAPNKPKPNKQQPNERDKSNAKANPTSTTTPFEPFSSPE